ncbi:hypothetical protein RJ640_009121 [Escallonia rubra]|uniref:Growth-regulating factor n=1 Tax=Escallonia rubra TaxID=112253 RepID=A0AA88QS08_9ASTE|nr:hypothetical protein RJ640_009121 [Escallonia rubra]
MSGARNGISSGSSSSRFPFTASQWQELEHQALIFKYMISGMPIPPDLLFTIKRGLDSSLSSKLILQQPPHAGWNCYQMGYGRKIDPEPGRCKRTDGKKWRCSKEAYADSKYCERHMHRGRNRSRKPVEVVLTTTNTSTTSNNTSATAAPTPPTAIPISSITKSSTFFTQANPSDSDTHHHNPFLYPHSSSSRPPGIGLSSQEYTTHFLLESGPYSHTDKNHSRSSYGHGIKEEIDEHAFFSESSGTMRSMSGSSVGDSWHLGSPLSHSRQRNLSGLQNGGYSYLQLQSLGDTSKQQKLNQDQDYHVLGKPDQGDDEKPQKVMHHFIDEWPHKSKDSWLDSESSLSNSTTQLSISMPSHDFFMTHEGI